MNWGNSIEDWYRFASLHYIASLFLFMKMPCIGQSEWHVAPPPQPLPNSHLHMNLLHSTEPDIWANLFLSIQYILAGKVDPIKMSKYRAARDWSGAQGLYWDKCGYPTTHNRHNIYSVILKVHSVALPTESNLSFGQIDQRIRAEWEAGFGPEVQLME